MGLYIGLDLKVDEISKDDWVLMFNKLVSFIGETPLSKDMICKEFGTPFISCEKVCVSNNYGLYNFLSMNGDIDTFKRADGFWLVDNIDRYKKYPRDENGFVRIWHESTYGFNYHKYILATVLVLAHYMEDVSLIYTDSSEIEIDESKKIVEDLIGISVDTKNIRYPNFDMDVFIEDIGDLGYVCNYNVFEDAQGFIKKLLEVAQSEFNVLDVCINEMSTGDLKHYVFATSFSKSYIWNIEVARFIQDSEDIELLRKYAYLISLNPCFTSVIFNEDEIDLFSQYQLSSYRAIKQLVGEFLLKSPVF